MLEAPEIILFFKHTSIRDILWLTLNAKLDNVAEWMQRKGYAMHKWGVEAQKKENKSA